MPITFWFPKSNILCASHCKNVRLSNGNMSNIVSNMQHIVWMQPSPPQTDTDSIFVFFIFLKFYFLAMFRPSCVETQLSLHVALTTIFHFYNFYHCTI